MESAATQDLQELFRLVQNLLRTGTVYQVDHAAKRLRVKDNQGWESNWLRWGEDRAGKDTTWDPPQIGEQVLVASPAGQTEGGIVLCTLSSTSNPPPTFAENLIKRLFSDGGFIQYNHASGTLTLDLKKIVINSEIEHTGNHTQMGDTIRGGKTSLLGDIEQQGKHSSTGDQVAGVISQIGHRHSAGTPFTGPAAP